jgi:hypothetical protein
MIETVSSAQHFGFLFFNPGRVLALCLPDDVTKAACKPNKNGKVQDFLMRCKKTQGGRASLLSIFFRLVCIAANHTSYVLSGCET